jgi:hypothetical protein
MPAAKKAQSVQKADAHLTGSAGILPAMTLDVRLRYWMFDVFPPLMTRLDTE